MSDESDISTPPETRKLENATMDNVLPVKSRLRYETEYKKFVESCTAKGNETYTENALLEYFEDLTDRKSLWSLYSMLKLCLKVKHNLDISKYSKLTTFIKHQTKRHTPKKSKILKEEEIAKFITEAPDNQYLLMKVALILGISGACRREELCKMTTEDITLKQDIMMVVISETETYKSRTFFVTNTAWVKTLEKYIEIRSIANLQTNRLFYTYREGKCVNTPVGINTFGKMPTRIAEFLMLPNPNEYTGHCFRTSSTKLSTNKRNDTSTTRHRRWTSSGVVEGYIEESVLDQIQVAHIKTEPEPSPSTTSEESYLDVSDYSDTIDVKPFTSESEAPQRNKPVSRIIMEVQPSNDITEISQASQFGLPGITLSGCENCTINIKIYNNTTETVKD